MKNYMNADSLSVFVMLLGRGFRFINLIMKKQECSQYCMELVFCDLCHENTFRVYIGLIAFFPQIENNLIHSHF